MRENLKKLQNDFRNSIERIREAYRRQYGTDLPGSAAGAAQGWSIERVN